ncbi:MAG: DMT family transporter [Paracoccaceae bacterium]
MAISPDPVRPAFAGAHAGAPVLAGNILGVASMVTWATAFPAAEFLLQSWPPLALITARLIIAVLFLLPVWVLMDGTRAALTARWGRGIIVGGIGFGVGTYLLLVAQDLTDPVTVALIASCGPLAGTLIELANRQRQLTGRFAIGMGASILGGAIATNALSGSDIGIGAACAVVSVAFFSWGSHRVVVDFPDLTPIGRTTITLAGALIAVGAICLGVALFGPAAAVAISPKTADIAPLLLYAVVSMAVSQAFWLGSVGRLGVALASFHMNVAPFYVMLIMLAMGDSWDWTKATGAAIVGLGVIIAQSRPRRRGPVAPV